MYTCIVSEYKCIRHFPLWCEQIYLHRNILRPDHSSTLIWQFLNCSRQKIFCFCRMWMSSAIPKTLRNNLTRFIVRKFNLNRNGTCTWLWSRCCSCYPCFLFSQGDIKKCKIVVIRNCKLVTFCVTIMIWYNILNFIVFVTNNWILNMSTCQNQSWTKVSQGVPEIEDSQEWLGRRSSSENWWKPLLRHLLQVWVQFNVNLFIFSDRTGVKSTSPPWRWRM